MEKQNKLLAYLIAGLAITMIAGMPIANAASEYTTTVAHFNVPSAIAFTVTLYGESASESAGGGTATTDIEFNCTESSGTQSAVHAKVVGGNTQSDGNPIMEIDNTGTVNLQMQIKLNATVPACMTLNGGTSLPASQAITNSPYTIDASFTPAEAAIDWYMQTDFSSCTSSDSTTRTIYINGTEV